jgi:hypothetical protein
MKDDPDLRFLGFSLWIDSRQFPDVTDYWDNNWLMIRARMEAQGTLIKCDGAILTTMDIKQFRDQLAAMVETLEGEARLEPLEPELKAVFKIQRWGQLEATIEITPDHLTQHHSFFVDADQSYLPALVSSCDDILTRFPINNNEAQA